MPRFYNYAEVVMGLLATCYTVGVPVKPFFELHRGKVEHQEADWLSHLLGLELIHIVETDWLDETLTKVTHRERVYRTTPRGSKLYEGIYSDIKHIVETRDFI